MTYIQCNGPEIAGYSACWQGRILALYAHRTGDVILLHKEIDICHPNALWIHMRLKTLGRIKSMGSQARAREAVWCQSIG